MAAGGVLAGSEAGIGDSTEGAIAIGDSEVARAGGEVMVDG